MIYREFGRMRWNIGAIGMGTWNIGNQWGEISEEDAFATIRKGFEAGINLFDTSDSYGVQYGLSEKRLGIALKGLRQRAYIVSKVGYWGKRTGQVVPMTTPDMVRLCVHGCLYRLRTDWIDVMLCHEFDIMNPDNYIEAFEMLKESGEIREYGISTNNLEVLKRFNINGNCSVVEMDYSLLNKEPENELLPYCKENNIAVLVRGPLAQGVLSGKYNKDTVFEDNVRASWNKGGSKRLQFEEKIDKLDKIKEIYGENTDITEKALRYVISYDACPVVIPGAKSAQQAIKNAKAGEKLLSEDELKALRIL
jgi:aryl-alcohol dehydrogenase-like predicted oxidoreductase